MKKALILKEAKLCFHPTNYLFLAMAAMLLIPNYPLLIAFFFPCLGLFYACMDGREQNDVYFTALLPIAKRDVVRARYFTVVLFQLGQIVLSVPFIFLRRTLMPHLRNGAGMEASFAMLGFALGLYALFNLTFLPWYYKTTIKIGTPFVVSLFAMALYIVVAEAAGFMLPALHTLVEDVTGAGLLRQLPLLCIGLAVYAVALVVSYRVSARRFERIDL